MSKKAHNNIEELLGALDSTPMPKWQPGGYYSDDGDCVFVWLENTPHRAEWVDSYFTAYHALSDGRFVGGQFKSYRKWASTLARTYRSGQVDKKSGAFRINVVQLLGNVISMSVGVPLSREQTQRRMDTYSEALKTLGRVENPVEVELPELVGAS